MRSMRALFILPMIWTLTAACAAPKDSQSSGAVLPSSPTGGGGASMSAVGGSQSPGPAGGQGGNSSTAGASQGGGAGVSLGGTGGVLQGGAPASGGTGGATEPHPNCDGLAHCADRNRHEWTLLVVPDTQHYTEGLAKAPIEHFDAGFDWIVMIKDQLNIQMVQGLGDITENRTSNMEWDRAVSGWKKLHGKVPFAPNQGNHDDISMMNQYFPVSDFQNYPWWGESFGGIQNSYQMLSMGVEQYLFVNIQNHYKYPEQAQQRADAQAWLNQVIASHPNHKVILATHDTWETNDVREQILVKHDNIVLSNAGHSCVRETEFITNGPTSGLAHNFVEDYQCDASEVMLLRYYIFRPLDDLVSYYTYSPVTDMFETDANSQGEFPLVQRDQ